MNARTTLLIVLTVAVGCREPDAPPEEEQPEGPCEWSEPHRIFAADPAHPAVAFGRGDELMFFPQGRADELFFAAGDALYLSDACGEDLRDITDELRAGGLNHLDAELALDCDAGTVHRRGPGGALVPVFDGVDCDHYFETDAGFFATIPAPPDVGVIKLVRLLLRDAPELPVAVLHDEPLDAHSVGFDGFVGPFDLDVIEFTRDRFLTGHWSTPFVALTAGAAVVRIDPRGGGATTLLAGPVAELWPSPDGEAFAYRPLLADGTEGDLLVRTLGGAEHLVAAAAEIPWLSRRWWSVDGAWFSTTLEGDIATYQRLIALPSGQVWSTAPGELIMREAAGGLWLTEGMNTVRELYWEPLSGVRRELWKHAPLPWGNVRAAADGLELLIPSDPDAGFGWWGEGDLIVAPWDGSNPLRLSRRVSPRYTRLADGRIVTPRAIAPEDEWPERADLVLIDPAADSEATIDTGAALGRWSPAVLESESSFHRVIGDLLLYNVVDAGAARTGVWALSLAR